MALPPVMEWMDGTNDQVAPSQDLGIHNAYKFLEQFAGEYCTTEESYELCREIFNQALQRNITMGKFVDLHTARHANMHKQESPKRKADTDDDRLLTSYETPQKKSKTSGTVQSGTVQSGTVQSGTVQSGTVQSGTVQSSTTAASKLGTPATKQPINQDAARAASAQRIRQFRNAHSKSEDA